MSVDSRFSLDNLIVDEEEVRNPVIMPVTVLVCETGYDEQRDLDELVQALVRRLRDNYGFRKEEGKRRREGFLDVNFSGSVIKCIYARETPMRIDFEKGDLKINTVRLRGINPSYRVVVSINLTTENARVVLFGGDDKITSLALRLVNYVVRGSVKGNFSTHEIAFSKQEMDNIRSHFGDDIQYVFLSPGESEKLRKFAKKRVKGEIKETLLYFVRAKFAGYRVVVSPLVLDLIEEGKISILEIEGKISYGAGALTARVSSTGRITFFVPEDVVGRNQTPYAVAEELYTSLVSKRAKAKHMKMEAYFPGSA